MDIIKGLGTAADVLRKAEKIPEYQQILDAMKQLTEQEAEIFELKKENRNLKELLEKKQDLVFDKEKNSYWTQGGDGPFCSCCFDSENISMRMHPHRDGRADCPKCKTVVLVGPNRQILPRTQRYY